MRITDQIHILKHKVINSMNTQDFVYSLILFGDKITLVNTGPAGSESAISEYITQNGRNIKEVDTIIISRADEKYIGSVKTIKSETNCLLIAHYEEKPFIEEIFKQKFNFNNKLKIDYIIDGSEEFSFGKNLDVKFVLMHNNFQNRLSLYFPQDKVFFAGGGIKFMNFHDYINEPEAYNSWLQMVQNYSETEFLLSMVHEPVTGNAFVIDLLQAIEKKLSELPTQKNANNLNIKRTSVKKAG